MNLRDTSGVDVGGNEVCQPRELRCIRLFIFVRQTACQNRAGLTFFRGVAKRELPAKLVFREPGGRHRRERFAEQLQTLRFPEGS